MVFFNYATMQMAAKIVYYGPGLCGKTTNLHQIYQKTSPNTRGEMVSLETETDRTLFFDLLPLDAGIIGGFKTRLQLYTVPGQVFYNTTRQLVLKGADGIVFVADSQKAMLDANVDSLANLRENLTELGLDFDETPLVIQLNKRDLPNAVDKEILRSALDPHGVREFTEAAAIKGVGVFETLKLISRLTLKNLRTRMMGDQPPAATLAPIVRERGLETQRPQKATTPERPTPASGILESLLAEEEPAGPPRAAVDDAVVEEALPKSPEPEVKTVKVRSSVDVMAELDALRKKATQGKKRKEQPKIASKTMAVKATGKASEAKRVRLIVQLEDASGGVVQSNEDLLDVSGARTQTIDVKIEFESES